MNQISKIVQEPAVVGRHRLFKGDCLDILATLQPASVDVVVTSPPYNLNIRYGAYQDSLPEAAYLGWFDSVAGEIERVMKFAGSFFLNVSGSSANPWLPFSLATSLRRRFVLQNHIVWVKSISIGDRSYGHFKPVNSTRFLSHMHEHVFHFTRTGKVILDRLAIGVPFQDKSNIARRGHAQDKRCGGNTWYIPYETVQSKEQKFHHPAGFPVELPRRCIRLHGVACPVVLDPFAGIGTTLVAVQLEGGSGIGIEMDQSYFDTAVARLSAAIS